MLAVSSPLFSPHQYWPLEETIPLYPQHNSLFSPFEQASDHSFHLQLPPLPLQPPLADLDHYLSSATPSSKDVAKISKTAKKLNHNASERDRRKKINSLYSSLRSVLPSMDQMKKLSNPATISRILSYIPELQQQVEWLERKKEEVMVSMVGQKGRHSDIAEEKKTKCAASSSSSVISATRLGRSEMAVQISTNINSTGHQNHSLSQILVTLQEQGLLLLNASSFQAFDGKLFHNLHLQMESNCRMEPEMLSIKILEMFP